MDKARLPRKILSELDFPKEGSSPDERTKFLLEYAILAPSTLNSQPWKFKIEGTRVSFLGDFEKNLSSVDPERRQVHISIGSAVANFLVAADHFGVKAKAEFPEEGFAAAIVTLDYGETHNSEEHAEVSGKGAFPADFFGAVQKRSTSREIFKSESIPEGVLDHLANSVVGGEGILLTQVTGEEHKKKLAAVAKEALEKLARQKDYRIQASNWMRSSYSKRLDDALHGFSGPLSILNSRLSKGFYFWSREARSLEARFAQAPLLCVVSTEKDLRQSWVRAGIALELLSLSSTAVGYETETTFAPIEEKESRSKVQEIVSQGGFPQALVRVGSAGKVTPTSPRKGLEEFLV